MPRKSREHYRHAFYHIMLRGNYRQPIFFDDEDKEMLLKQFEKAVKIFDCKFHLFCLMTNHLHAVIEVGDIPISKIMQSIFSYYVREHNRRFKKIGRLFQDRFKAKMILKDDYFLELCHYIHSNPINAGMCKNLDEYPWSSHLNYLKIKKCSWLTTRHIESLLERQIDSDSDHYRHFINSRNDKYVKPDFCELDEKGDLIIKDSVNQKIRGEPTLALENFPLIKIANVICDHLNIPITSLQSNSQLKPTVLARVLLAYYGHYHAKYHLKDIALTLGMRPDSLSKTLNRHLKKINQDEFLKAMLKTIERKLATYDPDKLIF